MRWVLKKMITWKNYHIWSLKNNNLKDIILLYYIYNLKKKIYIIDIIDILSRENVIWEKNYKILEE